MSQVVQATCPGCKTALRIPTEWLGQWFKCKHCARVFHAKARDGGAAPTGAQAVTPPPNTTPVPPQAKPKIPVARPAALPPVARPAPAVPVARKAPNNPQPPSNPPSAKPESPAGGAFDFEDAPPSLKRYRRPSSSGGFVKGIVIGLAFLAVVTILGVLSAPYLAQALRDARGGGTPPTKSGLPDGAVAEVRPDGDKPQEDDLPPVQAKEPGEGKKASPGKRPGKGTDLPGATGAFPRRALIVSINNYLFANPITPGKKGPGGQLGAFSDRLTRGLRVPQNQIALLSDAAPRDPKPTVEPVLRDTIESFLTTCRSQDRVFLVLVGHVLEVEEELGILPLDGDPESKKGLIPMAWLYGKLSECPARQKVLVVDTCRFDQARGQERPGSGPMSEKLDALLNTPPEGVQVWSACVKEQYSYEFEEEEGLAGGLFLEELGRSLTGGGPGVQNPGDALPLEALVEKVNAGLKAKLGPLGKTQISRLSGKEAADGAPYDPNEAAPPSPRIASVPARSGGVVEQATIKKLLDEISFKSLTAAQEETSLAVDSLPPFSREKLAPYLAEERPATPLREEIAKARSEISKLAGKERLIERYSAPGDENAFKKRVMSDQQDMARVYAQLQEVVEAVEKAGADHRKEESKRWQIHFDYFQARLKAQQAYLIEYQAVLGQLRKELPARDPKLHNGWRLAAQRDPVAGDSQAKKLATESRNTLKKIIKEHPGTPWAILAKRDLASSLGLEWQPTR